MRRPSLLRVGCAGALSLRHTAWIPGASSSGEANSWTTRSGLRASKLDGGFYRAYWADIGARRDHGAPPHQRARVALSRPISAAILASAFAKVAYRLALRIEQREIGVGTCDNSDAMFVA